MNEKDIERRLVNGVRSKGGRALKWVCPGVNGVPDRLILMPGGRVYFAELKRPGGKPRPIQNAAHATLRRLGFIVFACVDSAEKVDDVLHFMEAER